MLEFLTVNEIKEKSEKLDLGVIIWGTGYISEEVYNTLTEKDVNVIGYGDFFQERTGREINSLKVFSVNDLKNNVPPIIVIATYAYVPVYNSLKKEGYTNVFGLLDSIKYPVPELILDEKWMLRKKRSKEPESNRVLLELYGNIGDTILLAGIVLEYIRRYGGANVWILVENIENAAIYKKLTRNIMVMSRDRCAQNRRYRRRILNGIDNLAFKESIILNDIRLYAVRRLLNERNSRIPRIIFSRTVPDKQYLPDMARNLASKHLGIAAESIMDVKSAFSLIRFPRVRELGRIKTHFVSIHLGSSKRERLYDSKKVAEVVKHIKNRGLMVVAIGAGETDERIWREVKGFLPQGFPILDLITKLSIFETASVIKESDFFFGTDSGLWNLSYALDKPSIVLYGGGEYGCFQHPDKKVHYITVNERVCFNCKWYCDNKSKNGLSSCINNIKVQDICRQIDKVILNGH